MKVYYQDYATSEGIDSNTPREMELEEALSIFYEMTDEINNFWGVQDAEGRSLQFMCDGEDAWMGDIPDVAQDGSYQRLCTHAEAVAFIKSVYANGNVGVPTGFAFAAF